MVEIKNAFIGKAARPRAEDVSAALGSSAEVWKQLVEELARDHGVALQEWKSISAKYGWSLRLKRKERTIIYLSPCEGYFLVVLILGDRAIKATRDIDLPKSVVKVIQEAPRYVEGTGVRLIVKGSKDLPAIRKLVAVKLAN